METEKSSSDLADLFKRRAEDLSTASNEKLRTVVYRLMLSESKNDHNESNWMLLVAGGTLALVLPNAKDLLDVYNILDFKIAIGLLLTSGALGLLAKKTFGGLVKDIEGDVSHSKKIADSLIDYTEKILALQKEAAEKGITFEFPASSFKGLFEPFDKMNLKDVRHLVASELDLREKDPHRKWQEPLRSQKIHSLFVSGQTFLLITAFALMLIKLHVAR